MSISKIILQFAFVCVTTYSFAQKNYLHIDFKPQTEILNEPHYYLYKNDSLLYTNSDPKNIFNTIRYLEKGKYKLAYETIFGVDTLDIHFKSENDYKEIILETEKPSREMLAETFSYVESLKNNEQITLAYSLSACFNSKNKKATILKENEQYFFVDYGQKRLITKQRIKKIIRYEKILKNLTAVKKINGSAIISSTCNEFFSLKKNGKLLYKKHVFCGTWNKFSEVRRWMK